MDVEDRRDAGCAGQDKKNPLMYIEESADACLGGEDTKNYIRLCRTGLKPLDSYIYKNRTKGPADTPPSSVQGRTRRARTMVTRRESPGQAPSASSTSGTLSSRTLTSRASPSAGMAATAIRLCDNKDDI
jgi:hypothetical protein